MVANENPHPWTKRQRMALGEFNQNMQMNQEWRNY
jgi:hypothetical protein